MSHLVPDRVDEQSETPMDVSPGGHENVSVFSKVKHRAKKLRDKVKAQYDHRNDNEEEEEESEEDEDQTVEKSDEHVEGVTQGLAGLSGLGTANKDDRSKQESEPANKSKLGDHLNINEEKTEDPDELRRKEGMLTQTKDNREEDSPYSEESEQVAGKRGDSVTEKEENGADVGAPSITQKAGVAMAGATGGMLGLGKVNKEEEKPNSSEFDTPPQYDELPAPVGLKEVPKPLEEEYQNLLEKSKSQEHDVGEGNGLKSDENPSEEAGSGGSVVTKNPSGLLQGLKNSFTFDQNKKDATLPEQQSGENKDQGEQEDKGGQGYAQKLFAAKNVISSKLSYGGPPSEEKSAVAEPGEEQKQKSAVDETNGEDNAAKKGILSKIGLGGPPTEEKSAAAKPEEEEDKERSAVDEPKGENNLQYPKTEGGTENKETLKNTLVSKLSPGEDDKALSAVITEAFNNSAKSLLGGFYGGCPKNEVPPSPSSETKEPAELPQNSNPQNASPPKGIVGRVTGVMSSFIGGKKPKEADNLSPRTHDAAAYGDQKEDLTGIAEPQTGNRIEEATK